MRKAGLLLLILAATGCGVLSQDDPYRVPRPAGNGGTTTQFTFENVVEDWQAAPGSYFPGFAVEEQAGWPRHGWPRGDSQSRAVLAGLASQQMDRGYAVVIFRGAACPRCSAVHDIMLEIGARAVELDWSTMLDAGGGVGREVKLAMDQLDPKGEDPVIFLGTRLLGTPEDVEAMFMKGELHARLRAYGHQPRTLPPVNRAPVVRIQAEATVSEAGQWSAAWSAGWIHPRVVGRLDVSILEARGLTAFAFSYDPVERKVVSNPWVEASIETHSARTLVETNTVTPVWPGGHNMSMFPIETPGSLLLLRVLHDDELLRSGPPLEMGRALLSMPLTQRPLERWVDLVGERAGDRVAGEVRVGMRYTATNHVELQLGRRARVGGIVVADSDVLNSTVRITVTCLLGSLALPSNRRIAILLADDPLAREDPRDPTSRYSGRYGGFGSPRSRLGWVVGDGRGGQTHVFDARLADAQAALSELEYTSPGNGTGDVISVAIDDRGHTGAGGNKSDSLDITVELFEGAVNEAPRLTMWPENRGKRVLPTSLGAAASREVPLGVELALHGVYLEDSDALDGLMQVTITAEAGVLSLHGLGPWHAGGAGRTSFEENVRRHADETEFEVWGQQLTTWTVRGYTTRNVLCTTAGGFSDEFQIEGPLAEEYQVRRNSLAGEDPAGASPSVRALVLHAGHALPLSYEAETDFELQVWVQASSPINLLVLTEDNYNLYTQISPYTYLPGPSLLGVSNGTVERFLIDISHPARYFVVLEEARDVDIPGWQETAGGGEWATQHSARDIAIEYAVRFQRVRYPVAHFAAATGEGTLEEASANQVCHWLHADRDHVPPPGLRAMDVSFSVGDGHRDAALVFLAPLAACQSALATLSYVRAPRGNESDVLDDAVRISVSDLGHSGSGGAQMGRYLIVVSPINASE
ncbi:hypothetical protein T484DRAFT_1893330, partial [Baffinella frigidus]